MTRRRVAIAFAFALASCLFAPFTAHAGDAPSPTPQPSATASPKITIGGVLRTVLLTQGVAGPGLTPVEGPGFANGAPAAPVSPYDPFSAAPLVPGDVAQEQMSLDVSWRGSGVTAEASGGVDALAGDRTNEAYWVEPLQPQDNPHIGSTATGYAVAFPTHPGVDDYDGARAGLTQIRASLDRTGVTLRAGWFDLGQTLPCVFTPPATTNALPSLTMKTPESLAPGPFALNAWDASPSTLPLRGFDLAGSAGAISLEAADAALPALPGTPARMETMSAGRSFSDGDGWIVQWLHAHTGGDPISTTTDFGAQPTIDLTGQGLIATSLLRGQRESIVGGKDEVDAPLGLQATIEGAYSHYEADGIGKAGFSHGGFVHAGMSHALGDAQIGIDFYHFEPTFATMILPYGSPENIWSVAYSWPGPWLKSDFQLVDSSTVGVNREGPLYSYRRDDGRNQLYVTWGRFRQIQPFTTADGSDLGFVEGFFLIQLDTPWATIGTFTRTNVFLGRDLGRFGDLGIDFSDDDLHRAAPPGETLDAVSFDAPQYVVSLTKRASSHVAAAAGFAYFGTRGSWADGSALNVDIGMKAAFAGAQIAEPEGALMITARRNVFGGAPYFAASPTFKYRSPDFTGTTLFVERRLPI
ncbi:MAG TPA: hypothetical protein VEV38_09535 [Candidatus Eremiobacteraceae bacterium]|nr:hypothetical protein [Candidatus Eremiobacteraceae bacterium]